MPGSISENITHIEYINLVDAMYLECKKKHLSRFSDEWDDFSRQINVTRKKIVESTKDDTLKSLFNQCLVYWFNRSELLESFSKSKLIGKGKRKKLIKEGSKIRENIVNNKVDNSIGTKGIIELFAKYHQKKKMG
jgi:hypothetical protein